MNVGVDLSGPGFCLWYYDGMGDAPAGPFNVNCGQCSATAPDTTGLSAGFILVACSVDGHKHKARSKDIFLHFPRGDIWTVKSATDGHKGKIKKKAPVKNKKK